MLPVAPTSPLWWVARWSSRLLTGLALAVALSLGGSAAPDAGALAAAPRPANAPAFADLAVPDVSAVRAAAVDLAAVPATLVVTFADGSAATLTAGPAATLTSGPAVTLGVGDAQRAGRALVAAPAAPLDPVASIDPAGRPAHPVTAPLPLAGLAVGATGPRAPPLG
ncbi:MULTISPECIES: hypothetical protein [unclassified Micromonospora]|uniref:hypothetical protein n=1 Tax=unclassified Micromonospora TaxID=2617518 RepID=UPI002FF392EB